MDVSIHAPARGATDYPARPNTHYDVSIHAPARGATGQNTKMRISGQCFNPRARTGRDVSGRAMLWSIALFQSTRPHGARLGDGGIEAA